MVNARESSYARMMVDVENCQVKYKRHNSTRALRGRGRGVGVCVVLQQFDIFVRCVVNYECLNSKRGYEKRQVHNKIWRLESEIL